MQINGCRYNTHEIVVPQGSVLVTFLFDINYVPTSSPFATELF